MLQYIFAISLSLLFGLSHLGAQSFNEESFKLYTTKDGLSNDEINSIAQDQYGYIWIATAKGLNRFDGNNFQQYHSDTSRNSLPQEWVHKLKWLDKDRLAVLTTAGLHIVNTRTLETYNLIIPPDSLKLLHLVNFVFDVIGDNDGNIFIISRTGFYQFNKKNELVFRYDHYSAKDLVTKSVQFGTEMIRADKNILLLATTFEGMYIYYIDQKKLKPLKEEDNILYRQMAKGKNSFWFMHSDERSFSVQMQLGSEWWYTDILKKKKYVIGLPFNTDYKFTSASKLIRINDSLLAIASVLSFGFYLVHYDISRDSFSLRPELYFKNQPCGQIFSDKHHGLWIGTPRGLFRERRQTGVIKKLDLKPDKPNDLASIAITNNKLFGGTSGGLLVIDIDSLKSIARIDLSAYRGSNFIKKVFVKNKDTLLAGSTGIFWLNTNRLTHGKMNYFPEDPILIRDILNGKMKYFTEEPILIRDILRDSRNNIFISTFLKDTLYYQQAGRNDFTKLGVNERYRIDMANYMIEDPAGNIWFAGNGISRFNYQLKKFDLLIDSFPSIKVSRKSIKSNLVCDRKGKLYFGVLESGLIIYDPINNNFSQLTRSDGLPDNTILALCLIKNKLWIGTEGGLANYDLLTKKISSFGIIDDIPPMCNRTYSLYYDSTHNQLYAAFCNSVISFDPDKLTKNSLAPDFFIDNIKIDSKKTIYHPADKIELPYKNNNMVLNLSSINFEDAYQQQFAYRFVKNRNEPWQETGSQRSIIISNLSPGMHMLQVKVFIRNNSWPEQVKELIIYVSPPFWKTTWFILLMGVLILAGLSAFFLFRIRNIRRRANIDKQLAEMEMKALHAQMNPHFIFNSLNSIKEMILENEKQNASRYLSKFAQLIRTNLEQSRQTFITLKQCIDHLHQYLEMEKIRFEGFTYNIDAETNLVTDEIHIAPMLIQPLVENAIWHGLHNKKGDKHLHIRFYSSGEQLVCEIDDNGIGIKRSNENRSGLRPAHRSLGISNIHERLVILNEKYKMNCSLKITDKSELDKQNESGTIAVLRVNI